MLQGELHKPVHQFSETPGVPNCWHTPSQAGSTHRHWNAGSGVALGKPSEHHHARFAHRALCTCSFLSDCQAAGEPECPAAQCLGCWESLWSVPELVCGQDSNQANGWIINIPWSPWPSGCTATTRLISQLD